MTRKLLEVKDLHVSFMTYAGEVQAVRGVDLHVNAGETLAIVGESGCGKSVTVQAIMRLLPEPPAVIKKGSICFDGDELAGKSDKEMENYRGNAFSMIFQDSMTALNPTMKVGKQLVEAIKAHQKISSEAAKQSALQLLDKVGLPNPKLTYRTFPHTLSGGMRQRIMIAMALSCNPGVLFADEPTTALDVTMQAQILDLMANIKQERQNSIVLITHDLGVVAKMADRVAVMYAGQIIEEGDKEEIYYNPKHPYTWGLLGSMPNLIQERKGMLMSIAGSPPDLFSPPVGCAFAPRCDYGMKICVKQPPSNQHLTIGHKIRCWLYHEQSPRKIKPPVGRNKSRQDEEGGTT